MKQIVIYKDINDYKETYSTYREEFDNIYMVIVQNVNKIDDFSFKDYCLIITHNFNKEDKEILSKIIKKDTRVHKNELKVIHRYGN